MNECVFEIGDCVHVKSLEQLQNEYGGFSAGVIHTPNCGFTLDMSYLCGQEFHIKSIHYDSFGFWYFRSEEGLEDSRPGDGEFWYITEHMVVASDSTPYTVEIDETEWLSVLQ